MGKELCGEGIILKYDHLPSMQENNQDEGCYPKDNYYKTALPWSKKIRELVWC